MNCRFVFSLLLFLIAGVNSTYAWIYPEHRFIAQQAIQQLSVEHRHKLDSLWKVASIGFTERLNESIIDTTRNRHSQQIDYAAWTAIAGDHSCSPENMLSIILQSEWIFKVADITVRLQKDIAKAKKPSKHTNAIRNSDIRLQRADPDYATRAGSNNVHFLLSRSIVDITSEIYFDSCLYSGSELNALGVYSWFHASAKVKALKYSGGNMTDDEKSKVILSAMADEAFALHFLEDVFAAGHISGTWGNASMRKGTHDYYNEKGLETVTWEGKRMVVRGDAYMNSHDVDVVAGIIQKSLEQFIEASNGQTTMQLPADESFVFNKPDTFNVCRNNLMPQKKFEDTALKSILIKTPVPGMSNGKGELPRFRSELGMFIGFSADINTSAISGGFGIDQTASGALAGLEINARFGFGLDGVLNEAGDGLVFIQAGLRQDAASTNQIINTTGTLPVASITSAIPGRAGYNIRFRMPFWLVPGDLVIAAPFLAVFSPRLLSKMAVTAGNGGVIPWQSGISTPVGRFQFILGREVGISFFGSGNSSEDAIIIPTTNNNILIRYSSTKVDFPVLEYRPFRSFSMNQSSSIKIQLGFGFDFPHDAIVLSPVGESVPELKNVVYVGFRFIFDWRHYL